MDFYSITNVYCIYQELDSKVSLSLDAWTSSNKHPFLAIVMHYITNDWHLGMIYILHILRVTSHSFQLPEELLIDFHELIGEHSGENMADAVYETMKMYNLQGKVNHLFVIIHVGYFLTPVGQGYQLWQRFKQWYYDGALGAPSRSRQIWVQCHRSPRSLYATYCAPLCIGGSYFMFAIILYLINKHFDSCWNVSERLKKTRRAVLRRRIKTLW